MDLLGAAADMALSSKPCVWKKSMARKANNKFKWIIPLVAYGQVGEAAGRVGRGPVEGGRDRVGREGKMGQGQGGLGQGDSFYHTMSNCFS